MTGGAGEHVLGTARQRDHTSDDLSTVLGSIVGLTHNQRRLELDIRRLGLDVQRLDATTQLMGTSVGSLSEEVKQLGTYVRRLETKLDLNTQRLQTHLRTIMGHIGVPLAETLHTTRAEDADLSPPGEAGD